MISILRGALIMIVLLSGGVHGFQSHRNSYGRQGIIRTRKSLATRVSSSPTTSIKISTPPLEQPPFTLSDVKNAIPPHCFQRDAWRSMTYLFRDVAVIVGLAAFATRCNHPLIWPLYWFAQGTMFWALFVIGHDCGHQSFSSSRKLNDLIGHITHSSILVPYHGWRISHRKHHANHGHVENDESWYPLSESQYKVIDPLGKLGRYHPIGMLFAYPFYLLKRTPGKSGSHFDPENRDLFAEGEGHFIETSNAWYLGMVGVLAGLTWKFGLPFMIATYFIPYLINVVWLDVVTYLHHTDSKTPWYRDGEWSYLRGGLSTIDRDYGIFNEIHHDIGTHVVHHLFPQIPHYHLREATEAVKPLLKDYYREPEKSPGPLPFHLVGEFLKSANECKFVDDQGDVLFYKN